MSLRSVGHRSLAALLAAFVAAGAGVEARAAESSGATFLKIDPSPRTFALGGSNSAVSAGAQALHANPANLGLAGRKFELFSSFSNMMGSETYSHVALAMNRATTERRIVEALGISVTHLQSGSLEGRDRTGQRTSSFNATDRAIALSGSARLRSNMRLGLTGRFIHSDIAGYKSGMTIAGDVGLSSDFRAGSMPVTFGLAARNLGQGISYINQKDALPTTLDAGFTFGFGPATALLGATHLLSEQKTNLSFGMEFGMGPLALRAGYRQSNERKASSDGMGNVAQSLSTGIGVKMGSVRLDYAMSPQPGEQGISHRGALTLAWGQPVRASVKKGFIGPEKQ